MAGSPVDLISRNRRSRATATKASRALAPLLAASAVACSAFLLTGCVASGFPYAAFERDAQATDEVPAELPAYAGDSADLDTARFVGEHDGTSLWLMRGSTQTGICILAYRDEEVWPLGCISAGAPMGVGGLAGSFTVVPDDAPAPEGAVQVSKNVYAVD